MILILTAVSVAGEKNTRSEDDKFNFPIFCLIQNGKMKKKTVKPEAA